MDSKDFITRVIAAEELKNSEKLEAMKFSDFSYFCYGGARTEALNIIDTSNGMNFDSMFYNCSDLTTVPKLNTSKGTNFSGMFFSCQSLTSIPDLDTSNGTNFAYMFYNCPKLTTIPALNTSNGTNFSNMFYNCPKLTTIPALNTSNGTNFSNMFNNCSKLTTIPALNTSSGKQLDSMFQNCKSLTTIPHLDIGNCTYISGIFQSCESLTNLTLYNIRKSIAIGSGTSWGHLLTVDSLVNTIKELCTATSTRTLTMGSANLAKIADLYCKVTDNTSEKKPMELCESTDEGAMTLTEYAASKNWQLK